MLDQQIRQAQDPIFHSLLGRARTASLTADDLTLLNSKVITSLLKPELEGATTIVKLNVLRHHINRIQNRTLCPFSVSAEYREPQHRHSDFHGLLTDSTLSCALSPQAGHYVLEPLVYK
jgi:hypothetical protein